MFENCILLGHYAASSDNSLPAFGGSLSGSTFEGQDRLSRNVGKALPLLAA